VGADFARYAANNLEAVMRVIRTLLSSLLVAAALSVNADAQDKKPDLTGKWAFSVQSDVGTGTPTVTFKQTGDSISGRYSSQALGEHDFVGTFKEGKILFSFTTQAGGQSFTMSFAGALDGADAMKGTIDFSGMASGTFTGKRQKPEGGERGG
jgi:hypothetical protein